MIFSSQGRDRNFYSFGRAPDLFGALLLGGDERSQLIAVPIASDRQRSRNRLLPNPPRLDSEQINNPCPTGQGLFLCGDERNRRSRYSRELLPNPHNSSQQKRPHPYGWSHFLAETRGFEPPKDLTPYLISSEAHSTGLCDVSSNL